MDPSFPLPLFVTAEAYRLSMDRACEALSIFRSKAIFHLTRPARLRLSSGEIEMG